MTSSEDAGLTVLGQTVRHAIDHLECFDAPEHVSTVRFSTDEVMSICPVTEQPDISSLVIPASLLPPGAYGTAPSDHDGEPGATRGTAAISSDAERLWEA